MKMKYFILCLFLFGSAVLAQEMSLDEKVGQLLLVHFSGDKVNQEAEQLIEELHVGGFIYYELANALTSPDQVKKLSHQLQMKNKESHEIPLFIAIDQEGGRVTHLKEGFTLLPSAREVGSLHTLEKASRLAYQVGGEFRAVGVNMNLAPVIDVDTNPSCPLMGSRRYASDPKMVAAFGRATLEGYKESGIIAVAKHFPGYGGALCDPHLGLPTLIKSKGELERCDLEPFRVVAPLSPAIMTAHLFAPALDPLNIATFSATIVQGLLREVLGFQGVIMTDSLLMEGALQDFSIEEAAIRAFLAGHDILIIAGRLENDRASWSTLPLLKRVHGALSQAVMDGRITRERLNASVRRILTLKQSITPLDRLSKVQGER